MLTDAVPHVSVQLVLRIGHCHVLHLGASEAGEVEFARFPRAKPYDQAAAGGSNRQAGRRHSQEIPALAALAEALGEAFQFAGGARNP
jgi:hypothetical protein